MVIGEYRRTCISLTDQPSHRVIDTKAPVARSLGSFRHDVTGSVLIELNPSGKAEGTNIIKLGQAIEGYVIIYSIEAECPPYPTGTPWAAEVVECTINVISGRIVKDGSIGFIEGPVGNQSEIDIRHGAGIIVLSTSLELMPI